MQQGDLQQDKRGDTLSALSKAVRNLKNTPTEKLVGMYVHLRFAEMKSRSKTRKAKDARKEIEIALVLYGRRGGVKALEAGLAAARIKS
jgi:hypothetical protein